jgi:hypothetical protein
MITEPTNDSRARDAQDTLHHFEEAHGEPPYGGISTDQLKDLHQQNIVDLIANLAHYCDREDLDMQAILRTAAMHYDDETDQKGTQFTAVNDRPASALGVEMADGIADALFSVRRGPIRLSAIEIAALDAHRKKKAQQVTTGFDYKHQAWVKDGVYVACGHGYPCTCYGTVHEGQPLAEDAEVHP